MKRIYSILCLLSALTFFAASADAQTTVATRWLGAVPESCTFDKNNSQLIYVYGDAERGQYECVPPGVYRKTNYQPNASGSQTGLLTGADHTNFSSKVSPSRLVSTGAGLSGGGDLSANRTIAVDISSLTAKTSVAANDSVMIYDTSAGQLKKMSRSDFVAGLTGNTGTVTSVAVSMPSIFSVSGSPVTTSGTLSVSLASQTQNQIFAAPNGSNGAPSFRTLTANDIPDLDAAKIISGTFADARIPNLSVSKITSGTFADSFIPNLAASKITSGNFSTARIVSGTIMNERCLRVDPSGNIVTASSDCGAGGGAVSPLTLTASGPMETPLTIDGAGSQVSPLADFKANGDSKTTVLADGRLELAGGSMSSSDMAISVKGSSSNMGLAFQSASGKLGFYLYGNVGWQLDGDGTRIGSGMQYLFNSQAVNNGANDAGLARFGAGILKATNGDTGNGAILSNQAIFQKSASYSVAASESGAMFTNQGATAATTFTLPNAASGLRYEFCVQDADGIILTAQSGSTIRIGASVSSSGGSVGSTTIGSCIVLKAINSTEWFSTPGYVGTWTF